MEAQTIAKPTQREKAAAMKEWSDQVARVSQAGEQMQEALRGLRRTWGSIDERYGVSAFDMTFALPARMTTMFLGTTTYQLSDGEQRHDNGTFENWQAEMRHRGWLS